MASKLVLAATSALPAKQKRNIHINECVRRLRNCDPDMSWGERKGFLQEYVIRMFHAGYTESFRKDIVTQGLMFLWTNNFCHRPAFCILFNQFYLYSTKKGFLCNKVINPSCKSVEIQPSQNANIWFACLFLIFFSSTPQFCV